MAVTISNTTTGNTATPGASEDLSVVRASGEGLLVGILYGYQWSAPDTITSVVWDPDGDNQALTLLQLQQMGTENRYLAVYALAAPTSAKTAPIRVSFSGSINDKFVIQCRHITGHDTAAMSSASAKRTESDAVANDLPVTVASAAGELVVAFCALRDDPTYIGAGDASDYVETRLGSSDMSLSSGSKAGASSVTVTFEYLDLVTYDNALIAVAVQPGAAPPTEPSSVTAGSLTTTGATANWVDSSGDETGFDVEIAAGPSFSSWSAVTGSPVAAGVTSLAATGLSNATAYKFRVRAKNGAGNSSYTVSDEFLTQTPVKLRPSADITVGSWAPSTGTSLFAVLDESSPDDGDYVSITGIGTFEIQLTVGVDPTASYGHTVRYRIQGDGAKTFTVRLIQGTTIISTDPTVRVPPAGSWTTYEWTLTAGEANAISNYADLRGRVTVA